MADQIRYKQTLTYVQALLENKLDETPNPKYELDTIEDILSRLKTFPTLPSFCGLSRCLKERKHFLLRTSKNISTT